MRKEKKRRNLEGREEKKRKRNAKEQRRGERHICDGFILLIWGFYILIILPIDNKILIFLIFSYVFSSISFN